MFLIVYFLWLYIYSLTLHKIAKFSPLVPASFLPSAWLMTGFGWKVMRGRVEAARDATPGILPIIALDRCADRKNQKILQMLFCWIWNFRNLCNMKRMWNVKLILNHKTFRISTTIQFGDSSSHYTMLYLWGQYLKTWFEFQIFDNDFWGVWGDV